MSTTAVAQLVDRLVERNRFVDVIGYAAVQPEEWRTLLPGPSTAEDEPAATPVAQRRPNASGCASCGWIEGHDVGCGDIGLPRIPVHVGDPPRLAQRRPAREPLCEKCGGKYVDTPPRRLPCSRCATETFSIEIVEADRRGTP